MAVVDEWMCVWNYLYALLHVVQLDRFTCISWSAHKDMALQGGERARRMGIAMLR